MNTLIQKYKELYLALQKNGKKLTPPQKKLLIRQILQLEKTIIKKLEIEILYGNLAINLSQLPPRLKKIIQRIINRKQHILRMLELERIVNLKNYNQSLYNTSKIMQDNLFKNQYLEQNSISYLVKLQRIEDKNAKHSSKIIKKTLEKTKIDI
jgi:hypothetical protein